MKNASTIYLFLIVCLTATACQSNSTGELYAGKAFHKVQEIPGKIQCEYYDLGGEGIAFHDSDAVNSGSGNLNKGNDTLSTFRADEAVDISYTKFHDQIDNSPYNVVNPEENQLYVGWTEPGEWTKYSVEVKSTGFYKIGIMYTANADGEIGLSVDDAEEISLIKIPSTFHPKDSIKWRQWHHWNYLDKATEINLKKGRHTLTLHTVLKGHMNYDFLQFDLKTNTWK